MKLSTHWLNDYVKLKGSLEEVADRLTMAGLEVEKITPAKQGLLYDTEVTSNRPDWLSYIGVAREISALYGTPIKLPKINTPAKTVPFPQEFKVEIKDLDICPYYTGTILKGIKPCSTPDYMRERLENAGLRPINFLVDVTNFVLLECGQPLHAFDLKLLKNNQIVVRRAKKGEGLLAIDGKSYELSTEDLVIADGSGPVAIAGVMGGKDSEVNEGTTDILLESAFFTPSFVRATSKKLVLSTDSSYRFERRVDPDGVLWARERVISLILEHTEVAEITRVKTVGRRPSKKRTIILPYEKMENLLGAKIPSAQVEQIFKNLGLTILQKNKSLIKVSVPNFRPDLVQAVDLIEEVARIYGYERISETLPTLVTLPHTISVKPKFEVINKVTDLLSGAGFFEAQTFSIIKGEVYENLFDRDKLVKIFNPQNKELNLMRPSLIPGLVESAKKNQYRGNKFFKFFEVGQIYHAKGKKLPDEVSSLAFACYGEPEKTWSSIPRKVNVFDVKGSIEFLLQSLGIKKYNWKESESAWLEKGSVLEVVVNGDSLGVLGEAASDILKQFDIEGPLVLAEISLEKIIALTTKEKRFEPMSKYPSVVRDMSLLVPDELPVESVRSTILEEGNDLLVNVRLFDVYKGKNIPKGVKSLALSLEYQSLKRTLGSEEVQAEHVRIAKVIQDRYNATLPSNK